MFMEKRLRHTAYVETVAHYNWMFKTLFDNTDISLFLFMTFWDEQHAKN